jgi:hypothetical protein
VLRTSASDAAAEDYRAAAVWALGGMGPAAAPAAEELRRLLPAADVYRRGHVAVALFEITGEYQAAVKLLAADLDKESVAVIGTGVIQAIEDLGPAAEGAAPALLRMLNLHGPYDGYRRAQAAEALAHLGPCEAPRAALPTLKRMMAADELPDNRFVAAEAIWNIDHDAATLMPWLTAAMDAGPANQRIAAMRVLAVMGTAAVAAGARLREITFESASPTVKRQAAETLDAISPTIPLDIRPAAPAALAQAWEDLASNRPAVACAAVWRLAEAGRPAADFLAERLKDSSPARPATGVPVSPMRRAARARQALVLQGYLGRQGREGRPPAP